MARQDDSEPKKKKSEKALTRKEQAFIEYYLVSWNGADAARKAGFAENSARITASRLLTKANIRAAIEKRLRELQMSADEVLTRLSKQARGDIADFVDFSEGGARLKLEQASEEGMTDLIHSITPTRNGLKIELYDAQAALIALGKRHGLFVDKTELSGEVQIVKKLKGKISTDDL